MNRRDFLTGIAATAVAPAIQLPAVAAPLVEMYPVPLTAVQLEISRLIAEHWQRRVAAAFIVDMEACWK